MSESTHQVSLLEDESRNNRHGPADHICIPNGSTPELVKSSSTVTSTTNAKATTSQTHEAIKDISIGSLAGVIGKVIEYPFDTIKVRLQSSSAARYAGPLDCFTQSLRAEGVAGLYRGISAPLFGAAIETSSLFFSYRIAQETVRRILLKQGHDGRRDVSEKEERDQRPLPLSALLVCGAASGAFTSLLLTPIELVKCQMQVPADVYHKIQGVGPASVLAAQRQAGTVRRSPLSVVASVYRHGGLTGFWHGQMGTLIRETGGSAAWFGSYEGVSVLFRRYWHTGMPGSEATPKSKETQSLPIWQQMAAGASAGMAYNFVFYPADTVKSRMQTERVGGTLQGQRLDFWGVGKALWREQGVRGMYRGCGITVGRAAPSSAFIFSVYETMRMWVG